MDAGDWPQAVIEFADRQTAERIAVRHLRPELATAETDGAITRWWFLRKTPCWRLRYLPADERARHHLARILDGLSAEGHIVGWTTGIYEPEALAFGGTAGMDVAHDLFHQDSRHILHHLARCEADVPGRPTVIGRRELAILLCSVLMRGAGQDWYEQGDVWAKVASHRPMESYPPPAGDRGILKAAVHRLMTVDTSPAGALIDGGPMAALTDWFAAFERAGQQLADLARRGALERGLRAVLAHHLIFHFNRLGLPYAEQSILTTLTKEVVMSEHEDAPTANETISDGVGTGPGTGDANPEVAHTEVAEEMTDETDSTAEHLRNELVDRLCKEGTVRTARVEAALRAVPRHLFVPAARLDEAYADGAVYTKHDATGQSISAASQPTIVAMMLEQLQVEPGQRVLEIGAGTGYNAGLLAHLVGEAGQVCTVDVDDDIVTGARAGLAAAGYRNVRVILGDGALGHADGAPYDRVIATVGSWDLPSTWLEQLAPDGLLVVPLRLRGGVSRSIVFELENSCWTSRSSEMCTFMPLRGIADDARRVVPLAPDDAVTLHTHQEQSVDAAALADVLSHPRSETWTGVLFAGDESVEWLYLWLTCTMDNALSRMPVQRSAIDSGLVTPHFGWGAMAVADRDSLAYLTIRQAVHPGDDEGAEPSYEVGVIGHGPGGDELSCRVAEEMRRWDRNYRSRTVHFEIQPGDPDEGPDEGPEQFERIPGRFAFDTPHNRLIISWA